MSLRNVDLIFTIITHMHLMHPLLILTHTPLILRFPANIIAMLESGPAGIQNETIPTIGTITLTPIPLSI